MPAESPKRTASNNDQSQDVLVDGAPKARRRYLKSGFFTRELTPEEKIVHGEIIDDLLAEHPDVADNTAWMLQAEALARNIVLTARCIPPRTPSDDHGLKVSVSRDKLVMMLMHQLGLTRAQHKTSQNADALKRWSEENGFNLVPKPKKRYDTP